MQQGRKETIVSYIELCLVLAGLITTIVLKPTDHGWLFGGACILFFAAYLFDTSAFSQPEKILAYPALLAGISNLLRQLVFKR